MDFKKHKAKLGGDIKFVVIIKNWIHQGFFYLDKTEKFYRLLTELILFCLSIYVLSYYKLDLVNKCILSFVISHTLNWVCNDNFWTALMFTFPQVLNPGEKKTITYLTQMQKRLSKSNSISGGMIFGSLSRKKWHIKSDLDIRFIRNPGIINGFYGYLFIFKERIIALINKQPLDVYMADNINFLRKMRKDEFPLFLKNRDSRLHNEYGTCQEVNFSLVTHLNQIQ